MCIHARKNIHKKTKSILMHFRPFFTQELIMSISCSDKPNPSPLWHFLKTPFPLLKSLSRTHWSHTNIWQSYVQNFHFPVEFHFIAQASIVGCRAQKGCESQSDWIHAPRLQIFYNRLHKAASSQAFYTSKSPKSTVFNTTEWKILQPETQISILALPVSHKM
jgi:hypothetical protein